MHPGTFEEPPNALAARVASRFDVPTPLEAYDFPEKGNINQHTFLVQGGLVRAGGEVGGEASSATEYLLQRINQHVFTRPRSVMAAMVACIEAQKRSLERGLLPAGREWETIELVPTREGSPCLEHRDRRGLTWWRLMVKIPECRTFKSLGQVTGRAEQLRVAEEAGRGLALFGDFTADMDCSRLESPLPGYRDTQVYFDQLSSVLFANRTAEDAEGLLPTDPVVRQSTQLHFLLHLPDAEYRRRTGDPDLRRFIDLAQREESFGTAIGRDMETGRIRTTAIHGDTKLDNFLFSTRTGRVKALVDLDTIMPLTWLADWGDMVRSLANVAGEKETDLDRVRVDMEIYEAMARGFLSTARAVTDAEVERMVDAVETIALELGIRFLADHLRGDSYFRLGPADPPDLNKTRAMVQLRLFELLRERSDEARSLVDSLRAAGGDA